MQKRKIEDSAIFQSYSRIISGESLTAVAKEMKLDRGTLRNYIKTVVEPELDETQREKFYKMINRNYRGNSTENKRKNRNGKKKISLLKIETSEAVKRLADYGVTPEQIKELYERLEENKKTKFARDTFIYKCLEHLDTLIELDFSVEESFSIFLRRPKLFSMSSSQVKKIFDALLIKIGNKELVKKEMLENPWVDLDKRENLTKGMHQQSNYGGER